MSVKQVKAVGKTLETTGKWLEDIKNELDLESQEQAYDAFKPVIRALRDRLTIDEAVELGAQLPLLLKGVYLDGWDPSKNPEKIKSSDEFVEKVRGEIPDYMDAEKAVKGVFSFLGKYVSEGEIKDVKSSMPSGIKELWPG